jgi:hypothetical protein
MKYTYQISFNSSDYFDLTRGGIQMDGFWEPETMIWRENISELKITKKENSSIYNTLDSWFDDATKFETRIWVKILNNSVQESLHWFGIKWGDLDRDQTTYIVQPIVYDLWSQYFESTKDIKDSESFGTAVYSWFFYDTGTTYPFLDGLGGTKDFLEEVIKELGSNKSGWTKTDIVSSFLWQDNYEDASAVGTFQGMAKDYVTGEQSYMNKAAIIVRSSYTFANVLEWLKLFRIYVFFDTNDKLRLEHIKFFNDKLTDNAVDYSAKIESYDDEWNYENTSLAVVENISLDQGEDSVDEDFQSTDIIYSVIRNRPDAEKIDYQYNLFSDIGSVSGSVVDEITIAGAIDNCIYKLFDVDMVSFSSDFNSFNIQWNVGTGADKCKSSDIRIGAGLNDIDITVQLSSLSGQFDVYLVNISGGADNSNKITVSSTGTTTGTLTPIANVDSSLRIEGTSGSPGSAIGWIAGIRDLNFTIPTIDGIGSGSPQTSGAFSVTNIIDSWWKDDRLSRSGTISGVSKTFDGTEYNLRRETIRIYSETVPNPLYGFNDGTRIGKIEKWTRYLDTNYYDIDIIYQEDE